MHIYLGNRILRLENRVFTKQTEGNC